MAELSIEVCYLCDNVFQQYGFTDQTEAVILVSLEKIVIYLFFLTMEQSLPTNISSLRREYKINSSQLKC